MSEAGDYMSASELVDGFCAHMRVERTASAHTIRAYRCDLESFFDWARRNDVDPLLVDHRGLRGYLSELDAAGYARSTINRRVSTLHGFYEWLVAEGHLQHDPSSSLSGPKMTRSLPRVIRPAEMERLLGVHADVDADGHPRNRTLEDVRDAALLELLYASGLRVAEASGLLLEDVDFRSGLVKVLGKRSKERIVPVHSAALRAMSLYVQEARPVFADGAAVPWFFLTRRGGRMSPDAIRKMFKSSVAAAGLDENLSPHSMRHSFATDVLGGGADLRSVQEMLGHASLSTTQIYTHVSPDRLKLVHKRAHPRG